MDPAAAGVQDILSQCRKFSCLPNTLFIPVFTHTIGHLALLTPPRILPFMRSSHHRENQLSCVVLIPFGGDSCQCPYRPAFDRRSCWFHNYNPSRDVESKRERAIAWRQGTLFRECTGPVYVSLWLMQYHVVDYKKNELSGFVMSSRCISTWKDKHR